MKRSQSRAAGSSPSSGRRSLRRRRRRLRRHRRWETCCGWTRMISQTAARSGSSTDSTNNAKVQDDDRRAAATSRWIASRESVSSWSWASVTSREGGPVGRQVVRMVRRISRATAPQMARVPFFGRFRRRLLSYVGGQIVVAPSTALLETLRTVGFEVPVGAAICWAKWAHIRRRRTSTASQGSTARSSKDSARVMPRNTESWPAISSRSAW